jgi:DNA transformation protein and related proteins
VPVAVSDDYREFVLEQLRPAGRVTARPMFGGVGLYLDGVFFALIDDDTLYFKTDDSNRARYELAGSPPFCPYPDRPEQSMGYWQVPPEVLEDADELAVWAREAENVALAARTRRPLRRRATVRRRKTRP